MREILFKARRVDNGEWVEGDFIASDFIAPHKNGELYVNKGYADGMEWGEGCFYRIDPTTVCQDTGLTNKNGVKIWECDIVKGGSLHCTGDWTLANDKTTVTFEGGMFKCGSVSLISFARQCEVIGNIHDKEQNNG